MPERIRQSLDRVERWVENHDYKGYDPGDGLTSFLRPLTFGNAFAERILQQAVWKLPINIRPLVGIAPLESTKGRGFMAWGYSLLSASVGGEPYAQKAYRCLDWLERSRETGYQGHCWGNHFDFTTRGGRMKAHTPTVVWTGLIGQAFIEAYERLGDSRFLDVAESICEWILTLPREVTSAGTCISYVPHGQCSIHNSNLLGAGMLARTWKYRPRDSFLRTANAAVLYSCTRQRTDGSWWYGEAPNLHWIDNFHTAYNIDSLKRYSDSTGDRSFDASLNAGYDYFTKVFFEQSGRPRYYHSRTFPVDIQCAAQAIDTLSFFAARVPEALLLAKKVADWTIRNMQDPSGYFYYRRYPMITAKTPYFHWGQATMFKALAHLHAVLTASVPQIVSPTVVSSQ